MTHTHLISDTQPLGRVDRTDASKRASDLARRVQATRRIRRTVRPFRSRIMALYSKDYDFPLYVGAPRVEYMLATLPRSGSTYFALLLWRSGVMGAPMEYTNSGFYNMMRKRLQINEEPLPTFWDELRELRTSPNGCFGYKMFASAYIQWARTEPEMLLRITPRKVVLLRRENLVAQAVSHSKAVRSGVWFFDARAYAAPGYSASHIRLCLQRIKFQLRFWHKLFAIAKPEIFNVDYESLIAHPQLTLRDVAKFLGVRLCTESTVKLPRLAVQRDMESLDWEERYRSELST